VDITGPMEDEIFVRASSIIGDDGRGFISLEFSSNFDESDTGFS
jgi:hypothetical protein